MRQRGGYHRASLALGVAAVVSAGFFFVRTGDLAMVRIASVAAVAVLLVLGVLAGLGGWLGRRALTTAAGAGFALAAVVQLVQLGRDTNWFDGDGSTFSLWLAFAIGLLTVGVTPPPESGRDAPATG